MRKTLLAGTAIAALALGFSGGTAKVEAFGDKCYAPLSAKGDKEHTMRAAMHAAIHSWRHAASDKHGSRFSDWYYSGDRNISCKWDAAGRHFWCTARALPCGHHH